MDEFDTNTNPNRNKLIHDMTDLIVKRNTTLGEKILNKVTSLFCIGKKKKSKTMEAIKSGEVNKAEKLDVANTGYYEKPETETPKVDTPEKK